MAVTFCNEISRGGSGVHEQNGRRFATRVFCVRTDSPLDGKVTVLAAPSLPQDYDTYSSPGGDFDNGIIVVHREAQRDAKSRRVWWVTVEYSSEYERLDNPLLEPVEIDLSCEEGREPIPGRANITYSSGTSSPTSEDPVSPPIVAVVKDGILNSAFQPFDPPAERRVITPVVTFTRNQKDFTILDPFLKYVNTVNRVPWNGLQARQAWCRGITAQAMCWKRNTIGQPDLVYYRVTYVFALKAETWDLQLLDSGPTFLNYKKPDGSDRSLAVRQPFMRQGVPYIGLLDHSDATKPGRSLVRGSKGTPDDSDAPISSPPPSQYLRWRIYREEDYVGLNINLNLGLTAQRVSYSNFRPFPDPSKTPIAVAS